MLSESRKYRLSVVTANQFLGQVPELIRYAIIGNVGTLIAFRIGAYDAPVLSKELGMPEDALINLPNFEARVKRIDGGSATEAIHIRTLLPHSDHAGRLPQILRHTRNRHARARPATKETQPASRSRRKRF